MNNELPEVKIQYEVIEAPVAIGNRIAIKLVRVPIFTSNLNFKNNMNNNSIIEIEM